MTTLLLGPSHIAMVAKGVSAIVASRDAALRPSIMRAVGSHISGDWQEVTVYLRRSQSEQLLQDIAHTGEITVVFSVPSTHQTLQLKARRATQRPAHDGDLPVLQAYLQSMVQEVGQVGYGPQYVAAMLAAPLQDVVEVVKAADRLGYHHVTCSEHIGVPADQALRRGARYYDPLATFGHFSAVTRRIRFATSVLVFGYHHPLEIAKRYGTLDVVSGGRTILGLGVGSLKEEFDLLGLGGAEFTEDAGVESKKRHRPEL